MIQTLDGKPVVQWQRERLVALRQHKAKRRHAAAGGLAAAAAQEASTMTTFRAEMLEITATPLMEGSRDETPDDDAARVSVSDFSPRPLARPERRFVVSGQQVA
jgi:hypothetical protein